MVDAARRGAAPRSQPPSNAAGFTVIELLVVLILVGILTAIALPSFLNQAAKAKQARALKYIGAINRAQQSFFLEHNRFATSSAELDVGLHPDFPEYTFTFTLDTSTVKMIRTQAIPTDPLLRGYTGVVFTTATPDGGAQLSAAICQGAPASAPTPVPIAVGDQVQLSNCNTL